MKTRFFHYGTVCFIKKVEDYEAFINTFYWQALLLLTGCGGGAEGMADADGITGEGMEGEGIDALGMDEAPADLADDATAFMKTTQDNSGNAVRYFSPDYYK